MSESGYTEWDLARPMRRKRIGADCQKAYETGGDEQFRKAAARIKELESTKTCEWYLLDDDSNDWETTCGNQFVLNDGTPAENQMKHCCFCGGSLIEAALKQRMDR